MRILVQFDIYVSGILLTIDHSRAVSITPGGEGDYIDQIPRFAKRPGIQSCQD